MTPAARVQAAIEILDLILSAARANGAPADRIISEWFRSRRFAGSGDRRAVRELVYRAVRACGEIPATGRAAMLCVAQDDPELVALFAGSRHAPAPIQSDDIIAAGGVAPTWLVSKLVDSGLGDDAEQRALLNRAPLDIRVNRLRASRDDIVLPVSGEATVAPNGLRLPSGTVVDQWDAFVGGLIEVQDSGSQLVCGAVEAQAGETVIDLCAGAGGKTLALAAAMADQGALIASDVDRARLSRLAPRAERAGVSIAQTVLLNPGQEREGLAAWQGKADAVLIDAPCSGTGTWRRNPEARWRLTPKELDRLTTIQAQLLSVAADVVRPGGRVIYVTCSLLDCEGAEQIEAFLQSHPAWRSDPVTLPAGRPRGQGQRLTPYYDGTDGFFVARLLAPC